MQWSFKTHQQVRKTKKKKVLGLFFPVLPSAGARCHRVFERAKIEVISETK